LKRNTEELDNDFNDNYRERNNYSYLQNQNQQFDYPEENDEYLNYEKLKKDYQLHFDDEEE